MIGRRRPRSGRRSGRRSGPIDEVPWWDPSDQADVERPLITARTFGRGWIEVPMVANDERTDPFAGAEEAGRIRDERSWRRLTALDEGRAWRQRSVGSLAVLRTEAFARADERTHRISWQEDAPAVLEALWRHRWHERDVVPGWVEARAESSGTVSAEPGAAVDWFVIEDHTDPSGEGNVTMYQHVTIWAGRRHAVLVLRHPLGVDLDATVGEVVATLGERLR